MDSSPSADMEALKTLSAQPHQHMFASMLQWVLEVGPLFQTLIETQTPRGIFRRHSSSSKKKQKKDKKRANFATTPSDNSLTQTEHADLHQLSPDMATALFHQVVESCREFMATFSKTHKFVFHLASMRRMYLDLVAIGTNLDRAVLCAGLNAKVNARDWKKQLDVDREKEEEELSARAAKNALPFARNMLPHEPMEALTLLKFEIDFFTPGNTAKHVASMKKVFFSVVRSSNGRVAKIPDWYIPPYAVNYSRDKVMYGSVGTAHRGVWVDRKPKDGKKPAKDDKSAEQPPKIYRVVVKRIFIHADAIELFRQEVEAWFAMDHPNVLKLYGASHCSRPALLVCEDATNESLVKYLTSQRQVQADKRCKRGQAEQPWPYRNQRHALWSLFLQAANGLKYLHENHKLVHGNLKSDNILVTADGQVKLTDFGLGILALQNQAILDNTFHELGSRAPNCWKHKKLLRRPSFQDDIYSFGMCVLDVLVPKLSSIAPEEKALRRVGDEDFEPLEKSVLELICDDTHRKLIEDMCKPKPEERLKLADVIVRMEEMRAAAASEPVDSSDCCML
ncbi:TKL protein kinase [Phytophthora nicotianae P1569]|uniref:TKL protein kinase n=4 Tax=Phytophthora nicotianae TaxID=4792 RepID=V9FTA7_PHYNI|nr:TKL protein kinase [Phytophthora nicotianae P1569]